MATEGQQATASTASSQLCPTRPLGTPLTPERKATAESRLEKWLGLTERKRVPRERLADCLGNALLTRRILRLAVAYNLEERRGQRYRRAFDRLLPKHQTQPVLPRVDFQPTKSRLSKQGQVL